MAKKGFINGFWLKTIMAFLMLLDHIHQFLPHQPVWMNMAGRLVAPVFAFLVAEGLHHTRDQRRYISRMLWFGIAMLAGNTLLQLMFGDRIPNSILVSLAISAQIVDSLEHWHRGENKLLHLGTVIVLYVAVMFFEGAWLCPVMVSAFYFLRPFPVRMCVVYAGIVALVMVLGFGNSYQWMMIFALVPIMAYNGERGPSGRFSKYFFYIFYPAHIWALYLIAHLT